jgi:hypothetical protein
MRASRSCYAILVRIGCVVLALTAPLLAAAQDSAPPAPPSETELAPRSVSSARVADQLGTKLANGQPEELAVGASATATLAEPAKLAAAGLRDAKAGARVTIMRIARDRMRIEVDEFDPVPRTRRVTLRVESDGRLGPIVP